MINQGKSFNIFSCSIFFHFSSDVANIYKSFIKPISSSFDYFQRKTGEAFFLQVISINTFCSDTH